MKIVLVGAVSPYRGGLATFNERLCKAMQEAGHDVSIYNFKLQYPNFLFPGTSQYLDNPHKVTVKNFRKVNSINPFNWIKVGLELYKQKPDVIIFRYWLSFMVPCYWIIAQIIRLNKHTKIIAIVDNAIPHERKFFDIPLAKLFFNKCHKFIVMSQKVQAELKLIFNKDSTWVPHPIYDSYAKPIIKSEARNLLNIKQEARVILFFGFIRHYKGLDVLLEAMQDNRLKEMGVKLLLAGEFYNNRNNYEQLLNPLISSGAVLDHSYFIDDKEIHKYFCSADVAILPYRSATQSGITQICYNYNLPMIGTDVGGLKEFISPNVGLLCAPNAKEIANTIVKFYSNSLEENFKLQIPIEKQKYTWDKLVNTLLVEPA